MNSRLSHFLPISLSLLLILLAGCAASVDSNRVDIKMRNSTSHRLLDVGVYFGDGGFDAGVLSPSIFKVYIYFPSPIAKTAHVRWKDEAGKENGAEVNLNNVYRPGEAGVLEFIITDQG